MCTCVHLFILYEDYTLYVYLHIYVRLLISYKEYNVCSSDLAFSAFDSFFPVEKLPLKRLGKLVTVADLGQTWESL